MPEVEFSFEIGALSPESFPMERLGEYIADLGAMLGQSEFVHFLRLEVGSTRIIHTVQQVALTEVEAGLTALNSGTAEPRRQKAFTSLNNRLKEDHASGVYKRRDTGAVILAFPGVNTIKPEVLGPIEQNSVVEGVIISLGDRKKSTTDDKDKSVRVLVQSGGEIIKLSATRDMARQLGPHIFGQELRLSGKGRWFRHELEGWQLERFKIESFEPVHEENLLTTIADLRAIEGEWDTADVWHKMNVGDEDL